MIVPNFKELQITKFISNYECLCRHTHIDEISPNGVDLKFFQVPSRLFPQPKGVGINFIPNSLSNIIHNTIPPAISALKLYYILYHIFIFFSNYLQKIHIRILFNLKFFIFSFYLSKKLYIHNF